MGTFDKPIRFVYQKIDIYWDDSFLTHYIFEVYKTFKAGDEWEYDFFWKIPFYAPSGKYRIVVNYIGIPENDNDD